MKLIKYLALMVLAVFLISTVAFAEETAGANSDASKTTVRPVSKDKREDIRDKREDIRDKREDVREKLKEFNAVKERFKLAENKLKAEKVKFIDVRDRFKKECAADSTKNICKTIKSEIKANAKPHLLNTANAVLEALNRLRARTESSDYLEEADKKEILSNIDAKIANVKDLMAKIEALNENSTPEEIKQVAEDIKVVWKNLRPFLELQGKKVGIIRIGGVIKKSEKLEGRLQRTLEKLKSKGFDVSNLDALITEFNNHIKEAKANHVEALKLISAGDVKGAHEKLTEAKKHLKLAQDALRKIVQEIKNRDKTTLETPEPEEAAATEEQTTIATQ